MLIHASCAAREDCGVLLTGPPGSGKSDLVLRLIDRGFTLVADDQVEVVGGLARSPPALAGLLEIRGLGIIRLPFVSSVQLVLSVKLGKPERLPSPQTDALGLPMIMIDPNSASAAQRIDVALDCAAGRTLQFVGTFTSC